MNSLKKLRQETGFSQYRIADWLGISRSTLNMAERGLRELPTEAFLKLAVVTDFIEKWKASGKKTGQPGIYDQHSLDKMRKLAAEHQQKMEKFLLNARGLQIKLGKIRKKHEAIDARSSFLAALNADEIIKTTPDERWIEFMHLVTRKEPVKRLTEQEILQDKIDLQLAYADIHKKHWQKFSKI